MTLGAESVTVASGDLPNLNAKAAAAAAGMAAPGQTSQDFLSAELTQTLVAIVNNYIAGRQRGLQVMIANAQTLSGSDLSAALASISTEATAIAALL